MGMAAGQARLLSITTRMADNELRAQIINNNKMRLATESSQVSESYVTALNEAQLMFTNYDANNNTSYQQLTFNALTSYNPYNNQYALSNASGQIYLSESDAANYKASGGDLIEFLKQYGLEQTTTYFDNVALQYDEEKGGIPCKTGTFNEDGVENYIYISPNVADGGSVTTEQLAEYIQGIYEGTDEKYTNDNGKEVNLHQGYDAAVSSADYYEYTRLLADYTDKKDKYIEELADRMSNRLEALTSASGKTLSDIENEIKNAENINTMKGVMNDLSEIVTQASGYQDSSNTEATDYFDKLKALITNNNGDYVTNTLSADDGYSLSLGEDGKLTLSNGDDFSIVFDSSGNGTVSYTDDDDSSQTAELSSWSYTDDSGYTSIYSLPSPNDYFDATTEIPSDWSIEERYPNMLENMQAVAKSIVKSLRNSIYNIWDPDNSAFNDTSDPSYQAYIEAAKALSEQIFGEGVDVGEDNYALLDDIEAIYNGDLSGYFKGAKQNDFAKIYDVYLLDSLMNTYGEPNYTWIDTSNPNDSYNENGEAKAQWYENLFNRIQENGYQILKDGLASSSDWIKFAFESGLVTMEQVDSSYNWNSMTYSNCSDITEQTNDTMIAKAEAEYKTAMNKIETKDKRYDLELKNIDTEHNSLQTEYDSIKTAIDKNIERSFKLYS